MLKKSQTSLHQLGSSEQFDASLNAVLNSSSFNTVYRRAQYQSLS